MNTTKTLAPGSYSTGTLRPEDTVPVMIGLLRRFDPVKADDFQSDWDTTTDEELRAEIAPSLMEELDAHCPDGHYFGGHDGDPADIGVWAYADQE